MTRPPSNSVPISPGVQIAPRFVSFVPSFPFLIPPAPLPTSMTSASTSSSLSHPSKTLSPPRNAEDDAELVCVASTTPSHVATQPRPIRANRAVKKDVSREIEQEATIETEEDYRRKRYQEQEVRDLVRFRLDMQQKFETMSNQQGLWMDIGVKMVARGHYKRPWISYREKWGSEIQRYQKEKKDKLKQLGFSGSNEEEGSSSLVFEDDMLQEIHRVMQTRPKLCSPQHVQNGPNETREPAGSEETRETEQVSEPGGKRIKKSSSSQSTSEKDMILTEALERIEKMDVMGSSENWKDVLHSIASFTRSMVGGQRTATADFEETELILDKRVEDWLKSIGREKYVRHFLKMGVDWMSIMYLQEIDVIERSGMPIAVSRHVWAEIQKLRSKRGFGGC